jgi:hypothetical protein
MKNRTTVERKSERGREPRRGRRRLIFAVDVFREVFIAIEVHSNDRKIVDASDKCTTVGR